LPRAQVVKRIKGAISSKVNGMEDKLAPLVAEACIDVCPKVRGLRVLGT
jgi:T-complex protein 1 subunit theta